jgi:predicted DNA-binding transcriptional regulator AlpA
MMTYDPITLNAAQAAGVLGLAPSTLAKLRLSGDGPVYCKLGRRVVYRRADLEAWLESRVARDTSDAGVRLPKSLTVRRLSGMVDRATGNAEYNLIAVENERIRR